jgi:hypothetical protein
MGGIDKLRCGVVSQLSLKLGASLSLQGVALIGEAHEAPLDLGEDPSVGTQKGTWCVGLAVIQGKGT